MGGIGDGSFAACGRDAGLEEDRRSCCAPYGGLGLGGFRCASRSGAGRRPALLAVRLAGGGVVGAGFALPRDAGRRPALRAPRDSARLAMRGFVAVRLAWPASLVRVSRSRAIGGGIVGAGFALPRDAGRRPALHAPRDSARLGMRGFAGVRLAGPALLGQVSRSRAMPVGDRRSMRCRSETGAPELPAGSVRYTGPSEGRRCRAFRRRAPPGTAGHGLFPRCEALSAPSCKTPVTRRPRFWWSRSGSG